MQQGGIGTVKEGNTFQHHFTGSNQSRFIIHFSTAQAAQEDVKIFKIPTRATKLKQVTAKYIIWVEGS